MNKRKRGLSKHWDFILLDIFCLEISYLVAFALRLNEGSLLRGGYKIMNVMVILAYITTLVIQDNYSGILRRGAFLELKNVIIYNLELLAITFFITFIWHNSDFYSRKFFGYFVILNIILSFASRVIRRKVLYSRSTKRGKGDKLLVISDEANVRKVISSLLAMKYKDFQIEGIVVTDKEYKAGETIEGIAIVASGSTMYDYALNHVVDRILLDYRAGDYKQVVDRFINMGIMVHLRIDERFDNMPNAQIQNIDEYTVVTTAINDMSIEEKVLKRLLDIFVSIIGLVFTVLLTLIIGPIIYFQSPGPIFFKQVRVGKNGRTFKFYKFRSMYMDAEERKKELMEQNKMQGLMFKMDDDPRIIPIGKFIRKTSLDEFPQFWNILKGDMSLVGTRPPTVDEYEQYEEHHKSRLAMKPGLTGMWQVSGRSDIVDFEEVVKLDNEYIRNFSIGLDIKILFGTVKAVLNRKGSV